MTDKEFQNIVNDIRMDLKEIYNVEKSIVEKLEYLAQKLNSSLIVDSNKHDIFSERVDTEGLSRSARYNEESRLDRTERRAERDIKIDSSRDYYSDTRSKKEEKDYHKKPVFKSQEVTINSEETILIDSEIKKFMKNYVVSEYRDYFNLTLKRDMQQILSERISFEDWEDVKRIEQNIRGPINDKMVLISGEGDFISVPVNEIDGNKYYLVAPKKNFRVNRSKLSESGIIAFFNIDRNLLSDRMISPWKLDYPAVFMKDENVFKIVYYGKIDIIS